MGGPVFSEGRTDLGVPHTERRRDGGAALSRASPRPLPSGPTAATRAPAALAGAARVEWAEDSHVPAPGEGRGLRVGRSRAGPTLSHGVTLAASLRSRASGPGVRLLP